jgi:thymidylate synthase ThyX
MSKKPKVILFNSTPCPVETMLLAYKIMHGQVPDSLDELDLGPDPSQLKKDFLEYCAAEPLSGGITETVSTNWLLKDCSRALQQQLTRTRTAAYSIQSLRVVGKSGFAYDEEYHIPENVKRPDLYRDAMIDIQENYDRMLNVIHEAPEVARGILPLAIFSPITMVINLRNLVAFCSSRLCRMAQGEIREVGRLMIEEVCSKMGEEFRCLFSAPCERDSRCPHADGCGWKPKLDSCKDKNTKSMKDFVKS